MFTHSGHPAFLLHRRVNETPVIRQALAEKLLALRRDPLSGSPAAVGECELIGHTATLICPENGTISRSRWG
jgi:hypothetical protein